MSASPLLLGIETSCDETAAAVVRNGHEVQSNVIASQIDLHSPFGGVVPEIASRSHTSKITSVIQEALSIAGTRADRLDAIAVTHRPGMIGCLLVGVAAAKALCWIEGLELIAVDHVRAHIHAAFMTDPSLPLPCLALVVSGGHTALYSVRERLEIQRLGRTRDDAAGEALDKGAAVLGLPYPGGPAIEATARDGDPRALSLPRPRFRDGSLDFSFSGLKTALIYHLRGPGLTRPQPTLSPQALADLAASYQEAVVDCLVARLRRAAELHPFRSVAIGGGVARNQRLRARIAATPELSCLRTVFPRPELCSDNGAMVAGLGTTLWQAGHRAELTLEAHATSRIEP